MRYAGYSQAEVARRLGRHRSTISRELRRNGPDGAYSAVTAQTLAEARRRQRPLVRKMDHPQTGAFVRRGLLQRWSPDQIAGRSRREFPHDARRCISHQTIYTWIRQQGPQRRWWEQFLRLGGRRPRRDGRGHIPGQVTIRRRPAVINQRRRYGDWEGDTLVGRLHAGGLLTLVERKSGYLLTYKTQDRSARRISRAIRRRLQTLPPEARRSVTFDNGKEFARHQELTRSLHVAVYFAEPYKAWQRGTNENTNGLLRQFFPKGTDFREVSHQHVAEVAALLNDRPRKRLGYQTPREILTRRFPVAFET
jgi:IS30 family transposase